MIRPAEYRKYLINQTNLMPASITLYTRVVSLFNIYLKSNKMDDKELVKTINEFITEHTNMKRSYYVRAPFKFYLKMLDKEKLFGDIKTFKKLPRKKTYRDIPNTVITTVLDAIEQPIFRLICKIQYETGARSKDIIRTRRGYVVGNEEDGYHLRIVGKGGKERWAALSTNLARAVLYLEKNSKRDLVFVRNRSDKGEERAIETCYHNCWIALKRAIQRSKAGCDFSSHFFRRKFITDAIKAEINLFAIQKEMGHARIDTTVRYLLETKTDKEIAKKIRGIE